MSGEEDWTQALVDFCRALPDQSNMLLEFSKLKAATAKTLKCDTIAIYRMSDNGIVMHTFGATKREVVGLRGDSILKHVMEGGNILVLHDLHTHPKFNAEVDTYAASIVAVPCVDSRDSTRSVFNAVVVAINPREIKHTTQEVHCVKVLQQLASVAEAVIAKEPLTDADNGRLPRFSAPVFGIHTRSMLAQTNNKKTVHELTATLPEFCCIKDEVLRSATIRGYAGDLQLEDVEIPITFQQDRLMGASAAMLEQGFNVFDFTVNELSEMVVHMLYAFELPLVMGISQAQIENFVAAVASNYNQINVYHNYHHAVNVFHRAATTVRNEPALFDTMVSSDLFSLLIAALCHDIDHPGLNNEHHKNAWTPLSIQYNDMSVTEQHHCAVTTGLICDHTIMLLQSMSIDVMRQCRRQICHAILHTDMFQHHHLIHRFNYLKFNNTDTASAETRETTIAIVLHMADMMNQCDPLNIAEDWERRLSQEFFAQVVVEKQMGLPVSPFMDAQNELDFYRNQLFFNTSFCQPLFQGLADTYPSLAPRLEQLKSNRLSVEEKIKQLADKKTEGNNSTMETFTLMGLWNAALFEIAEKVEQFGVELLLKATVTNLHRKLAGNKFRLLNTLERAMFNAICCPEVWLLVVELALEETVDEQYIMRMVIYDASEGCAPANTASIPRFQPSPQSNIEDSLMLCKKFIESVGGRMTFSTDGSFCMILTASFMRANAASANIHPTRRSVSLINRAPTVTQPRPRRSALSVGSVWTQPGPSTDRCTPKVIMNLDIEVMLSAKWQTVRTVLTDMLRQWGCQVSQVAMVSSVLLRETLQKNPKMFMLMEYTQYRWLVQKSDWWLDYSAEHRTSVLVMGTKSQAMHAEQYNPRVLSEGRFLRKPLDPEHLYLALSRLLDDVYPRLSCSSGSTGSQPDTHELLADGTRQNVDPNESKSGLDDQEEGKFVQASSREGVDSGPEGVESRPEREDSGEREEKMRETRLTFTTTTTFKASALVVEDSLLAFRVVQESLLLHEVQVTPAYNGQACLRVLEERGIENGFDFIFMDLEMPVMNGEQAVRLIRKMEQAGKIRPQFIIAMSAELMNLGGSDFFNAFMPKPIYPSKIDAVLHSEFWRDSCVSIGSSTWENFNTTAEEAT